MPLEHREPTTSVTYVLDDGAQIAAARANLWRYLRSRRASMRMAIFFAVMMIMGVMAGLALGEDPLWWMGVFGAEAMVLVPALYLLLFLVLPYRVRRLVSQSAIWTRPVEVTWSSAGMSTRAPGVSTEFVWADYHGWYSGRFGFLLYLNDQQYQAVPASALAEGQMQELRATLERSGLRRL